MIHESSPVTNAFVSVPADMGQLNCAAFLAGIIAGVLDSARFVSHILYSIMSIQQASCNLVKLSFVKDPDRGPWTVRPTGQSSIVFLSTFVRSHIFKYWWDVDERDLIMCLFPLFTFPLPSLHLPFSPSSFSPLLFLSFVLSTFFSISLSLFYWLISIVISCLHQHARVTAHTVTAKEATPGSPSYDKTVFLVKFSAEVMARERRMGYLLINLTFLITGILSIMNTELGEHIMELTFLHSTKYWINA